MLELAHDARRTADRIAAALGDLHRAIGELGEATTQATALVGEQTRGLAEIAEAVQALEDAVVQVST